MFDTKKFGAYISRLRKNVDMTQSELAEKLNLTRQAISKYEMGDSFPDISILIMISQTFGVTLDELINSGEPTKGEAEILGSIACGTNEVPSTNVPDFVNLAPLLRPSILRKMANSLGKQGIDISSFVVLVEYLNDDSVLELMENVNFDNINDELLEKLIPFLDEKSKGNLFGKILDGELDWHLIKVLFPYIDYMVSQIEEAVVEGVLPWEALNVMHEGMNELWKKQQNKSEYMI